MFACRAGSWKRASSSGHAVATFLAAKRLRNLMYALRDHHERLGVLKHRLAVGAAAGVAAGFLVVGRLRWAVGCGCGLDGCGLDGCGLDG
eukprot:15440503-Alexandrium_andersonii.AAC.1